jgi:hypothetical protein
MEKDKVMLIEKAEYQVNEHAILFFDDRIIAERDNVRKNFHNPRKSDDNPLLSPEFPWEGSRVQPWGSLYQWGDKWRCLYNGFAGKVSKIPGVAVLETENGKDWYRPNLGLHEVNGSRDNNLLIPCPHPGEGFQFLPGLIKHPSPPDESFTWLLYLWTERHASANTTGFRGMHIYKSTDGLNFTQITTEPFLRAHEHRYGPGRSNDVISVYYDKQAECFTLYAAVMLPSTHESSTPWDNAAESVRQLARWESQDGLNWDGPHLMLAPDHNEPAWQQYYGVSVSEYEGLWLGFPLYYHVVEQFMQPHLIVSYDRKK